MDKQKTLKAIESFRDSCAPVYYDRSAPVTREEYNRLISSITNLATELVNVISE